MIRATFIAVFFFTMTPLLISLQWLLDKGNLPGWGFISSNYYRILCRLLRIRVRVEGKPADGRAALYVSNHVSWADIVVIGSLRPVAFVAKREVASWPLVGITAKIQRTVFIDRKRRHQTADAVDEIAQRLKSGTSVVLFAEGTSSDGNRVLPFRSALLGAVEVTLARPDDLKDIAIQPMSISYVGQHGMPMIRQQRPLVAWYGDLDFIPHIKALISHGAIDAVVSYGDMLTAGPATSRKDLTRHLEHTVRVMVASSLRGRNLLPKAATAQIHQ